jgi:radical SAM superfamily enzyme YgiQ (UPF0313 family)/glycosyltransferase involved in cell wall biosynthesis
MVEHVYIVSSEWGGAKGGINVFNKSLVEALARVVRKDVQVHAVVQASSSVPAAVGSSFDFISYSGTPESLTNAIEDDLKSRPEAASGIVIIGHDVHTGPHAIGARELLKASQHDCRAGVICHMDYAAYQRFKGQPIHNVAAKAQEQRRVIREADCVYAVGPLLRMAFEGLRARGEADTPIHEIIPGFPEGLARHDGGNPSTALKFFFSGRIDPENDRIKNGRLALRALYQAYDNMANSSDARWRQRGTFAVFGAMEGVGQEWFCEGLDGRSLGNRFSLSFERFTDQEVMFTQLVDSHAALMPSVYEGFGLAGWEAVCAGIPLICSDQSGLAEFLEACFNLDHDLPRESVISVRLADGDEDLEALSDKIEELMRNYDRRRSHARRLADHLAEHFTWDACARSVASALGLAPLGSPDWRSRQYDGNIALARRRDGDSHARAVQKAMQLAKDGKALAEWSLTCTALNYLSDIGKKPTYATLDNARSQLDAIGSGIEEAYPADQASEPNIRSAGRFDVAWRHMAAASSIATSLKEFLESVPAAMMDEIRSDTFLNRELVHYSMSFSAEFDGVSEQIARQFFRDVLAPGSKDAALQTRFARLEAAFPALGSVASLDAAIDEAYASERDRCAQVKAKGFDFNDLLLDPTLGPTALALGTIDTAMRGRGIDQVFESWKEHGQALPSPSWRGDKLLRAALLGATIHPRSLVAFIEALAKDEEEALRWSAIDLAFSPALRKRLFAASRAGALAESPDQLKQRLGAIVDAALENGGFHPWMQREFLDRYHREHADPVLEDISERFTASDFPEGRKLLGPALDEGADWQFARLHPEVQISARKLREHIRRVLLVLPPISLEDEGPRVPKTSTPPLGLGMVGSHLLSQGHDVHLVDCHRTPSLAEIVMESASNFDWVGFNVVLPTSRSVLTMATSIKQLSNAPAIVVGGPAVSAGAFRNAAQSDAERTCWDFEIRAGAEANFAALVADIPRGRTGLPAGVVPNPRSQLVIRAGHAVDGFAAQTPGLMGTWPEPVLLDRRIFSTPHGQYEPQSTRAIGSTAVEAHVVMSRGCDWNCTFCTERRDQSGGERRRPVTSVLHELSELARRHKDLRVQFVDDNLLPQIAVLPKDDRMGRARALDWADSFLAALAEIKSERKAGFGWRGIFRVEDFHAYESEWPDFIGRLAASGCRMLAFGVEHGNEEKRRKMKAGPSASNAVFNSLFRRLRESGIQSKAYFILGGPKETLETAEETIRFALDSEVSIAYFAIYKEFVPAVRALRSEQIRGSDTHGKYSYYSQLRIGWDAALLRGLENPADEDFLRLLSSSLPACSESQRKKLLLVYEQLTCLGFLFSDLVKYSDHHADGMPSSEILNKVNFGNQDEFEKTVASAYIRFYIRDTFVDTYRALLADGY